MQLQGSRYSSVSQAFRSVYKTEGISAFYVSYPTTIMMTVPFTAVQFTVRPFLLRFALPRFLSSPQLLAILDAQSQLVLILSVPVYA